MWISWQHLVGVDGTDLTAFPPPVIVTSSIVYCISRSCRSKLLRMTIGMESSSDAGKFPDYKDELNFFKVSSVADTSRNIGGGGGIFNMYAFGVGLRYANLSNIMLGISNSLFGILL